MTQEYVRRRLTSFSGPHVVAIQQRCGGKEVGKRKLNTSTYLKTRGYQRDPPIMRGLPLNPFQKHMTDFESRNGICQPSVNL